MSGRVGYDEGREELVVSFRYRPDVKDFVKSLPGARFDWTEKVWRFAAERAAAVVPPLREHGFSVEPEVAALLGDGDADAEPDAGWTIGRLNAEVARALHAKFSTPLWIVGEVDGWARTRHRRHAWFDLVERAEDGTAVASVSAVLFANTRDRIERALDAVGVALEDGLVIRARVRVDLYAARGTYQVVVEDIDARWSAGELAARREEILRAVRAEGDADRNRMLALPTVPLRIAVLTSAGSDAWHDLRASLAGSGYGFEITVFDVRVQGPELERTVLAALALVDAHADRFDACVITRGGGGRVELSAWDNLAVARAAIRCRVPILVAIGHEQDQCVLDALVRSHRTPTEAGRWLGERVKDADEHVAWLVDRLERVADARRVAARDRLAAAASRLQAATGRRIGVERDRVERWIPSTLERAVRDRVRAEQRRVDTAAARLAPDRVRRRAAWETERLERLARAVARRSQRATADATVTLERMTRDLRRAAESRIGRATRTLETLETRVRANAPDRALERGFVLLRDAAGRLRTGVTGLTPGDTITVVAHDGRADATLTSITPGSTDGPPDEDTP